MGGTSRDNRGFRVRGGERAPGAPPGGGAAAPATAAANAAVEGSGGRGGQTQNGAPGAVAAVAAGRLPPAAGSGITATFLRRSSIPTRAIGGPTRATSKGLARFITHRFPLLKDAPLLATHSCHYELSPSGNFIVDRHPQRTNVWIAGGGNAEGFKFGPVIGEYIAQRVTGEEGDPGVAKAFRYDAPPDTTRRNRTGGAGNGTGAADSARGTKAGRGRRAGG